MRRSVSWAALLPIFLLAWCATVKAATPERWVEARSTHFAVLTDSDTHEAQRLASQFERMRMVFQTLFPAQVDDAGPPIMVVAVRDRKGMQALEPEAYLAKGQVDLAGLFLRSPDKNYILMRLDAQEDDAYATVYHEYTHYLLRKADGWLPLWLNEGLAQFYENTNIDEKSAWVGQANPEQLTYLNRNDLLPIATLLQVDSKSPYYHEEQKGSIFYAESWALTHYLIVSDRVHGTHKLHDYTQLLEQGEDAVTAAQHAFGDLGNLQESLSEYAMQRKFMYFMMQAVLPAKDAEIAVRPVTLTEANARRADVLLYTGRTQEAQALLESVLRDDPENAQAHETMGVLRYRAGDIAAARRWFGEALELNAQSYLAQYYSAMTALQGRDKANDETIDSSLRAAIELNAEFAPAYDALAMFYASRHRNLDEAHTLNLRAVALEPGQLSYRLNCAEVLTEQRQFADALGALQAAMHLARTEDEIATVADRVARVERYQTAIASAFAKPVPDAKDRQEPAMGGASGPGQ